MSSWGHDNNELFGNTNKTRYLIKQKLNVGKLLSQYFAKSLASGALLKPTILRNIDSKMSLGFVLPDE